MQMFSEPLVEAEKLVDSHGGEQEGNREPRRINRQQKHAARDGLRVCGQHQNSGENRADARCPAKGEGEAELEAAGDAGERATGLGLFWSLTAEIVEADVAVKPTRHGRPRQKNEGNRKQLN